MDKTYSLINSSQQATSKACTQVGDILACTMLEGKEERIKRNGRERKPERKHIATVNGAFFPIYVLENKDKPLMLIFQIMLPSKIISQTNTG